MLITQKNFGRALLLTATAGTLAGCGTSSATTSPAHHKISTAQTSPTHAKTLAHWTLAGHVPSADQISGQEPGAQHLWMLVTTPATANHAAEYVGTVDSLHTMAIRTLTPPLLRPTSMTLNAWGRTAHNHWWIAFTRDQSGGILSYAQNPVVTETAVWQPGQSHWTLLPVLRLAAPQGHTTGPAIFFLRGTADHAWLVSSYNSPNQGTLAQNTIYRLTSMGWRRLHQFPSYQPKYATINDQSVDVTGFTPAGPGQLFISQGYQGRDSGVVLSKTGSIQQRWTQAPPSIYSGWGAGWVAPPNFVFSSTDTAYLKTVGDKLWQWHQQSRQSLITPGSALANNGFHFRGLWHNHPVITTLSSAGPVQAKIYEHGQWKNFPTILRQSTTLNEGGNLTMQIARWSGRTLWVVSSTKQIYVKRVTTPS